MIIGARQLITCRGCGCDDDHACATAEGPCAWALLDVETATGVCSVCADRVDWHPVAMIALGLVDPGDAAARMIAFARLAPIYGDQVYALLERAAAA